MKIIKFNTEEADLSASFIFRQKFSFIVFIHVLSIVFWCRKLYNWVEDNNDETSTDEFESDDVFLETESGTIQSDNTHSEGNNTVNFNAEGANTDDSSNNGSTVMIIVAISICRVASLGAVVAIIKKRRA